jgi:hypothetical protein
MHAVQLDFKGHPRPRPKKPEYRTLGVEALILARWNLPMHQAGRQRNEVS